MTKTKVLNRDLSKRKKNLIMMIDTTCRQKQYCTLKIMLFIVMITKVDLILKM